RFRRLERALDTVQTVASRLELRARADDSPDARELRAQLRPRERTCKGRACTVTEALDDLLSGDVRERRRPLPGPSRALEAGAQERLECFGAEGGVDLGAAGAQYALDEEAAEGAGGSRSRTAIGERAEDVAEFERSPRGEAGDLLPDSWIDLIESRAARRSRETPCECGNLRTAPRTER